LLVTSAPAMISKKVTEAANTANLWWARLYGMATACRSTPWRLC